MKEVTALNVAWCILRYAPMSNLRLNNILYLIQCENYKRCGAPAFDDDVLAWKYGTVIPSVYDKYCSYAASNILIDKEDAEQVQNVNADLRKIIDGVVERYKDMYIWDLVALVCADPSRNKAYTEEYSVIPKSLMKEYFTEINMKILTVFCFETGDSTCRYWQVPTVVYGEMKHMREIEDSFSGYLESAVSDDKDYEDMVEDVLNASALKWEWANEKIPESDCLYTIWV